MKRTQNRATAALGVILAAALLMAALGLLLPTRGAAAQAPTPTSPPMPSFVYPTRSLFLRAGPSVSWRVITTLQAGEQLTVFDRYYDWYKVTRADGTLGWVSGSYVTMDAPGSGGGGGATGGTIFVRPPDVGTVAMVTAPLLNVRSGPGIFFPVVGTASNGELVTILAKNKQWRQVTTAGGLTGWVNSLYLSGSLNP